MMRAARCAAFAAVLAACSASALAADGLPERIRQASTDLRDLEALYREVPDAATRVAALELIMQRAVWLEQVGGMKDARAEHCLALARLEGFAQAAPLRYGYLAEAEGAPVAEAQVRRPRDGELPERLQPYAKRILYLNVSNASSGPLDVAGVRLEARRFGETKAEEPRKLPEGLQGLAPLFGLPERLSPGDEKQCMILLGENAEAVTAVAVSLRQEGQEHARTLRVTFPEVSDPDGMLEARKKAAAVEREVLAKREKLLAEAKTEPAARAKEDAPNAPLPEPKEKPKEDESEIGTVERAGAGALIQIRLKQGKTFQAKEILRVRKDGKWIGRIKVPEGVTPVDQKGVYWMSIVNGDRETLAGGTLHREE